MKKFAKRMLTAAGIFLGVGVVLGCIGAAGAHYTWQKNGNASGYTAVGDALDRLNKWDFRRIKGDGRGLVLIYDGIEFDENHDIVYGSFTDDGLRDTDVHNLDLDIGGGSLILQYGDGMELKKDGGPECQYYIEGDTFYLKQRCPVGGGSPDLILTLPEGICLEEVDIEMGAGEVMTKGLLSSEEVIVEMSAGEISMDAVETGRLEAEVGAGAVSVFELDAGECDMEVSMGSITLQEALVTGNMNAEVSMGEISIFLRDSYEDHDYEVDCGMGEITICQEDGKTNEYAGFSNLAERSGKNSTGESVYGLNCNMGNIYVKFYGKEGKNSAAGAADGIKGKAGPLEKESSDPGEDYDAENGQDQLSEVSEIEDIYGIEDNWPESIGRENINTTAKDLFFDIWIPEPMTLEISCVTTSGELDLKIKNQKDIFEKYDIQTGTVEVKADSVGMYRVYVDCDDHTGNFWIRPKD